MILMALDDVRPGMVVGVGLRNREGHTLLGPGMALTEAYIARLHSLGYQAIWIDDEDTRDIPYEDSLSEATRLATTSAVQDTFALTARETEKLRSASVTEVRSALETRRFQQAFQDENLADRLTGHIDAVVGEVLDRQVLTGLSSLRTHSTYMYHHALDVTVTATMIGRMLGYDRDTLKKLAAGCLLHDVGNVFIDTGVLDKPGRLTQDEVARMRDHTVLGYLFIRDTLKIGVLSAHIAYQHHERQDGSGYPRKLTGSNRVVQGHEVHFPGRITPFGEIAGIADFHDACSADRPYRDRLPPDQVWRMVRDAAGPHLNREIVTRFLAMLPPYPLGTQVVVRSGRWAGHRGVVARIDREAMDRPLVRLLTSPSGERIPPVELDLRRDDARIFGIVSRAPAVAGQTA
jgi:HD-GYP domain-containing protein (c-di-GMP phosphodiesterase class II)